MPGLNDLLNQLERVRKQIPFATAQALTSVARQIKDAQTTAIKRTFDNPTPFTANSVRSQGARKDTLKARVFIMDTSAEYLEPFEIGGQHKLNGHALLNPKNIRLNKYGNLGNRKMSQRKNNNTFVGEVGGVEGLWRRKKTRKGKKAKKRAKRSPNGTRAARQKQPAPKLLIRFGDALPVRQHLGYFDRANTMAAALMPSAMARALDQALRTAK
ncbi:hypothetical protein [Symbiopectobacterium purcellii]|uniref:HK97 gp10 family phage protein n=1 Tax=Symbiopectobacterium purcellii TaxID=2871826 RepID=A0ABX9AQL2_9ENTR|nr:hypothetical protein [Symbiopectobacterium purcellii]QZN97343.1 hypothetical protein K6K13_08375 [Symbiopectobacterium purcellii]